MSGNLERRTAPSGGLARGGTHTVESGQATDASSMVFDTVALNYSSDIPRTFRTGVKASTELALRAGKPARSGGELVLASEQTAPTLIGPRSEAETRKVDKTAIASGVRQLSKPRKSAGRVVQRRIGWQATPDRIVITTVERELHKTEAGKYRPSGDWLIEDRRTYKESSGQAAKRTGSVAADTPPTTGTPGPAEPPTKSIETTVAEEFPEGAQALGMLPAAVRSSAIARVASPQQFDGVILQYTTPDGTPDRIEVNVLRLDTERAVVIQGTQKTGATQWSVSQATYKLNEAEIEQA